LVVRPCCEPYDKWASRLRLAYSQRKKSARRKKGYGGSAWPTARAEDSESAGMRHSRGVADTRTAATSIWQTPKTTAGEYTRDRGNPDHERPTLEGQASTLWATPAPMQTREGWTAEAIEDQRQKEKAKGQNGNGFGIGLAAQATALWTAPQAHDVTQRGSGQVPTAKAGNACLARDATNWPTPAARDHKGENSAPFAERGGVGKDEQLPNAVAFLFSRPDPETAPHGLPSSDPRQTWRRLRRLVISTHGWARDLEADGREWWEAEAEPEFRRLVDGLADRTSKLRLLGNGVVPLAAAHAWRSLSPSHGLGRVDLGTPGVESTGTNDPVLEEHEQ